MKRVKVLGVKTSEKFASLVIHTAKNEDKKIAEFVEEALVAALRERGVAVPSDCPEYDAIEAPDGTVNAELDRLITAWLPRCREKAEEWAKKYAMERFLQVVEAVEAIDNPRLWNDAREVFGWEQRRSRREQIRSMEFRVQAYKNPNTSSES